MSWSRSSTGWRRVLAALALLMALGTLTAAAVAAQVRVAQVPAPRDARYPGTLTLHVDAHDTRQGIYRVQETIPVEPGPLTLLYPEWIPGTHAASGPISAVAGLNISANGQVLAWQRDEYDVYAFHVTVPPGVSSLNVTFQYLSPRRGGYQMTSSMLMLEWNDVALYPAGYYSRDITVRPSVTLPVGWQFATALQADASNANTTTFKPVTFNTLVDSPVYAGQNFKRVLLSSGKEAPVYLDLFADAPADLVMTKHQLQVHVNLVTQALRLFRSHHYKHYDFLFSLSNHLAPNGLEHHQSSEDGAGANYFTAWASGAPNRDLLAHEYVHSWNGKFRRPADLWTPNFNVPMGDSLLWVYEGQTQYWGYVLTARSGIWTPQQFRGALAVVAATYAVDRPGFAWRTLEDTTNDPTIAQRSMLPFRSWQMSEEYYSGGQLLWLAVDAKIRQLTHDQASLDTFARKFFGMDNGSFATRTYTFNDIVNALNAVAPYDWAGFLKRWVDQRQPPFLSALQAAGWKLVFTDQESAYEKAYEARPESPRFLYNFVWSIGLALTRDGQVNDVRWNSAAFNAGISTGAQLVAVNGNSYSVAALKQAITAAAGNPTARIDLNFRYQGGYQTIPVDYHGGLKYPHLVRVAGTPDYLSQIIAPLPR